LVAIDVSNPLKVEKTAVLNGIFPHRRYQNFVADTNAVIAEWQRVDTIIKKGYDATEFDKNNWGIALPFFSVASSPTGTITNGTGGSMARFALLQNRLYTVSNSDIKVFNTTAPEVPAFLAQVSVGVNDVETIFPFGNHLFLGSNTGMHIFNVSNPNAPIKTGVFTHARVCDPVIADQNFAYVTLRNGTNCGGFTNQLDVLNINNISSPTLVKSYQLTNPHGLAKEENLLFICDGKAGLKIFDATNPQAINLLKTIEGINTYDVILNNKKAMVVATDGLYCIDYSILNNAKIISKIALQ